MTDLKYFLLCIFGFILLVTGICVYFLSLDEQYVAGYENLFGNYNACVLNYQKFYYDYKSNCNNCLQSNYPSPNIYQYFDSYVYIGDVNTGVVIFSIGSTLILFTLPLTTYRLVRRSQPNFTGTTVQTEQHLTRRGIFGVFDGRSFNIFRRPINNQ